MKAVLITIGDEILSGNTIDTNSNFIATQLKNIGISVTQILTISDEVETIKKNLEIALQLGDLIITTFCRFAMGGIFTTNVYAEHKTFGYP